MAERPEDLNLPNAVITRIIKEAMFRPLSFCNITWGHFPHDTIDQLAGVPDYLASRINW